MKKALRKWMKNFNNAEGTLDNSKIISPNASQPQLSSKYDISSIDEFIPSKQMKLHFAVLSENETDVRKYSSKHANTLDSLQRTPLHLAVLQGNPNIVNILLENGASLDIVDSEGFSPFLRAVEFGNVELVKRFCDEKLNKSQVDSGGNTAIHLAVLYGFYSIADLLLKNGFTLNIANKAGDYPIHVAVQNESLSTVKLLLKYGALVDVQDAQERSPILLAIDMGNVSLAELFLKQKVNLELRDIDGKSVKDYIASSNNINMKLLFSKFLSANDFEISPLVNDEDSSPSEQSYILPPALKSPLSWNMLQKNLNSNEKASASSISTEKRKKWASELHSKFANKTIKETSRFELPFNEHSKNKYERNAKSLSFDVTSDVSDFKTSTRSYSLNSHEIFNQKKFSTLETFQIDDDTSSHEKLKSQIEDCQKALQELSLDAINKDVSKPENSKMKFDSDFLFGDFNRETFYNVHDNFQTSFSNHKNDYSSRDLSNTESELRNVTINIENVNLSPGTNKNDREIDDESSDDDPPFWKSSLEGGRFVPPIERSDTLKTIKSSDGEDSGSEKEMNLKEASNNVILCRLKQVSQENEDLETETAILREATEKLKYDLANYRQLSNVKEANLNEITAQLTQMDTKYSKAIEKINIFQLCMSNLEQEVAHLRHICNKSYKVNQQLMQQLKQMNEDNKRMKSEKDEIVDTNASDLQKLQTDVLYWKNKFEELSQMKEEKKLAAFEMQSLFKLNLELNKISDKIKNCLCKSDLAKLQDQQQVFMGQTLQQILNEADHKLQNSLSEIKDEVKRKVNEMDIEYLNKTETELKVMDLENTKQKLLLEVSKLTSMLKEKEIEEIKMKEQLETFTKEKQKLKEEKRKQLIKKSYEDRHSSRKGMYLNVVRNYLNKSRLNSSDSSPEPYLSDLKIDFDTETMTKENQQV